MPLKIWMFLLALSTARRMSDWPLKWQICGPRSQARAGAESELERAESALIRITPRILPEVAEHLDTYQVAAQGSERARSEGQKLDISGEHEAACRLL